MDTFDEFWKFEELGVDHRGRLVTLEQLGALKCDQLLQVLSEEEIISIHTTRHYQEYGHDH